ncbi:hypothetical protein Patl1_15621 [Pistacia atlantica]|uniref:Uncharacterized protein n=1 Tax=Pistacia atlantica TaxID=434234 RepID=A0ACC1BAQ7_9ROSI|nr:hypothetical protein Patl1_15621 [Pistacia atlantica]
MKKGHLGISLFFILSLTLLVYSQLSPDSSPMRALRVSLGNPPSLNWSDSDPCKWSHVTCGNDNLVTRIQIRSLNLKGKLPPDLRNLTSLTVLEVANNQLTGPIPSLAGLSSLQQDATALKNFSANGANVSGTIPDFVGGDKFPGLTNLHLAMNNLQGPIPGSFSQSSIQTLWLNGQSSSYMLNGSITVLQTMKFLTQLWLHKNLFSGPLPDFSGLINLVDLSLRENQFTGIVPLSLVNLPKLTTVNLTHNFLQGPTPNFSNSNVHVDMEKGTNSFCLDDPGLECDSRVNILLSIADSVGYLVILADDWKGNDPCANWKGITCDSYNNITGVDFNNFELSGTISPNFSMVTYLERLILSNNSLTGTIPNKLTILQNPEALDVSNNQLHGKMPTFRNTVTVNTNGTGIETDNNTVPSQPGLPPSNNGNGGKSLSVGRGKSLNLRIVVGSAIGAVCGMFIVIFGVCMCIRKQKSFGSILSQSTGEILASDDGDANEVKTTASKWSISAGSEFGYMFNSIQVLRNATDDFSDENILGRGGFRTVFKGKLQDGTEITVKRTGSGVVSKKALVEFKSEIEVLTKVRHRHLLTLPRLLP